jgi:hypothetical protein
MYKERTVMNTSNLQQDIINIINIKVSTLDMDTLVAELANLGWQDIKVFNQYIGAKKQASQTFRQVENLNELGLSEVGC